MRSGAGMSRLIGLAVLIAAGVVSGSAVSAGERVSDAQAARGQTQGVENAQAAGMQAQEADSAAGQEMDSLVAWYHAQYPYISMKDTIFTFETEFVMPEGYARPPEEELTTFQNWVSRMPIWHRYKAVGIWRGGKAFESDEIARAVHIPWHGPVYTDVGFPLRIAAEYCRRCGKDYEWKIATKNGGDTLDYGRWLKSKLALTAQGVPKLKPAPERDSSGLEFYRFLNMGMQHQTYASLAANGDSIGADQVRPGDLLIGHDETGKTGRVYFVINMIVNESGDRLYAVATGCPEPDACDYHIPLLTGDRNNPWVTVERMEELVAEYPRKGFFRMRVPEGA